MSHYDFYEGLRDDLVASGVLPARRAEPVVWEWKPRADYRRPNSCRSCAAAWMEPVAAGATEDCEVCR